MKRITLALCFAILVIATALTHPDPGVSGDKSTMHVEIYLFGQAPKSQTSKQKTGFDRSWDNQDLFLRPHQRDAYGPGIHSDATGRPFGWQTKNGQLVQPGIRVQPDAYGLGVGMDQYGRPVKPSTP